jgi:predicted dehydrogenase
MLAGVTVAGIASARAERASAVAERLDIPFATADYHALLDHVDAIAIVTPPHTHAQIAVDAIARGIHVFCEKPLAGTLAQARLMRDAAANAPDVVCMTNFQQRFTAHFSTAARMVHAGDLGQLVMADMRVTMNPVDYLAGAIWSDSKADWFSQAEQGGGLLASSVGPHLVDLLNWMAGEIAEVACRTTTSRRDITLPDGTVVPGIDAEDGFILTARTVSGALLTIRGVPVAYGGNEWDLELHGNAASLIVAGSELRLAASGAQAPAAIEQPTPVNPRTAIASTFIDAIRAGGSSPTPTFEDGLACQAVLEAALVSAQTRDGGWVSLTEYGEMATP